MSSFFWAAWRCFLTLRVDDDFSCGRWFPVFRFIHRLLDDKAEEFNQITIYQRFFFHLVTTSTNYHSLSVHAELFKAKMGEVRLPNPLAGHVSDFIVFRFISVPHISVLLSVILPERPPLRGRLPQYKPHSNHILKRHLVDMIEELWFMNHSQLWSNPKKSWNCCQTFDSDAEMTTSSWLPPS